MKIAIILFGLILHGSSYAFGDFNSESSRATKQLGCLKPKIYPPSFGDGRLYACIGGTAETVKFYINEVPGRNEVKNVKFMWNDWTRDLGDGIHADAAIAKAWVTTVATMYAPIQVEKVSKMFLGKKNVTIESDAYILNYTYHAGPSMAEHMYVIKEK